MTDGSLLSVGIDLGTSTTQLIFSRLHFKNNAAPFAVPDVRITQREILYKSKIHFTPLLSDTVIDAEGVRQIIAQEYEAAGIQKSQVQTGAVIITGETARKENAEEVLSSLSGFAGDFVVATAGPDLESVLAGAGAGAQAYSREKGCRLLHFDIGGGTTNMALYENGELKSTGCLNVGGRLIKVQNGTICYRSPVLEGLTDLSVGQPVSEQTLSPVISLLVKALEDLTEGRGDAIAPSLRTTELMELPAVIDEVSFSGGVADLIYGTPPADPFAYGDIGVLLGHALRASRLFQKATMTPRETIRATVVGAGNHTTRLSGSTISYSGVEFPVKNLPVLCLTEAEQDSPAEAIRRKLDWFRRSDEKNAVVYLPGLKNPSFAAVQQMADGIIKSAADLSPLYIAVEADMGKALGQAISAQQPSRSLCCVDGVHLQSGDYLDIGQPVANGSVLPVVVKTLIF